MITFRRASRLAALCLALSASAATAAARQGRETAGGLAVEIIYRDDLAPTYIPGNETVWFTRFRRIPSWQPPAGALPIRAVQVASTVEGETTVRLRVSVRSGAEFHDEVKTVATYLARVDEKIAVEELKGFGVVPVELRVVRARPLAPLVPYVENRTQALELLDIAPMDVSFPSYKVRLRNLSGREIGAVGVYYFPEKGGRAEQWLGQPQNQPLVAPGAIYELNASGGNGGQLREDGYAPDALKRVTITTVVFSDGTYEGDAQTAANINALWRGRKIQLARALPVVRESVDAPGVGEPDAVARFRARVVALAETPTPRELDGLFSAFPSLDEGGKKAAADGVRFELHKVKNDLLVALAKFEQAHAASPDKITFRLWLGAVQKMYEDWLARL